jgi:prepilin-type processing-associated H-X9-DG protein
VHPLEVGRRAVLAVITHRKMAYVGFYDGHVIMWDLDTTAFAAGQMMSGFPDLHSAADGGAMMGPMFVRYVSVGRRSTPPTISC